MIQCAPIFTDYMVLQQEKNTAVFGTGSPGETVTVSIPERKLSASTVVQPSGQSNMEFMLKNAKGGAEELKQCPEPSV